MEENNEIQFLSSEEITDLFGNDAKQIMENSKEIEDENNDNKNKITDEKNDSQESGGDDSNNESNNGEVPTQKSGSSIFTSIAKALKEEGIFPELDDKQLEEVKDAASLKKMFDTQVDNRLNSQTKRVLEVLNYGGEPSEIQQFENTLGYLYNIKEEDITAENKKGEELRRSLIYKDLINRGYSQEKAKREVEKSLNAGTDIEDAKDALEANRQYYQACYDQLRANLKKENDEFIKKRNESFERIKKSIFDKENAFNSISLSSDTKQKIIDNILKPTYKTSDGEYITALQKYERENKEDFVRYVGALFTLSDGFTDFSKLFKPVAQKAVKRGFSQLEDLLQGKTTETGNLSMMGSTDENYFSSDFTLDI